MISAGAPGVELLSAAARANAKSLQVAIDLSAVPPLGLAGIEVIDKAKSARRDDLLWRDRRRRHENEDPQGGHWASSSRPTTRCSTPRRFTASASRSGRSMPEVPRDMPALDVLVVAPHPDDAELGMAGAILKYKADGYRVGVLDLTDGEPTPFGSRRNPRAETAAATKILGARLARQSRAAEPQLAGDFGSAAPVGRSVPAVAAQVVVRTLLGRRPSGSRGRGRAGRGRPLLVEAHAKPICPASRITRRGSFITLASTCGWWKSPPSCSTSVPIGHRS